MSDTDQIKPYMCAAHIVPEPAMAALPPRVKGQKEHERLFPGQPCYYCGDLAQSVDHMMPSSKGGSNALDNKVPACHRCNQMKGDLSVEEFIAKMERILQTLQSKKVRQFGGDREISYPMAA